MKAKKLERELSDLTPGEISFILKVFKTDYTGSCFRDRFNITRQCLKELKELSRYCSVQE